MVGIEEDLDLIATGLRDLRSIHIEERNISVLNLHGNFLSHVQGLPMLQNLTELNLSSNRFITCELPELAFLPSLVALDLSGNNIDSLYYLPFLPGLRILSVSFNQIRSLAGLSENTPDLVDLDLRGNLIDSISSMNDVVGLKSLQKIWMGGRQPNPICNQGGDSVKAIYELFSVCDGLKLIDGKDEREWKETVAAGQSQITSPHSEVNREESSIQSMQTGEGESGLQEDDSSIEAPTPRFDQLAKRFKSHAAILRLSQERGGAADTSVVSDYAFGNGDLYLHSVVEDGGEAWPGGGWAGGTPAQG